ncbi:class I SAM-dependent methyltransferase [Undibacterium sp. CY18W]|uniref:Class I SAM-dependent methyltransferase n=1 Tax=Undibacterium hunanense TaxID=2762292 RepID=A0ABR6ZWP2_9BURK|nr:class I SAM-dependent methyltransferase [Undibacterium hunanense]MBC3920296.1 class I SAM-dependent methyltransferase [Undibacterium hunanense]
MAIQNKSESETQQLAEKASVIQHRRRHSAPVQDITAQVAPKPSKAREGSVNPDASAENQNPQPAPAPVPSSSGFRQKIRRIPGLGYALAWCNALLRLPRTRFQTEVALTQLHGRIDNLQQQIHEQLQRHADLQQQLHVQSQRIAELEAPRLAMRMDQYDALDVGNRLMQFDRLQIGRQLRSVNLMMRTSLQNERNQVGNISNTVPDLTAVPANVSLPKPAIQSPVMASDFDQDQFYLEFEALFRGSREDIKGRLKVYLPYLSHISAEPKDQRKMVIDVGCGRGEWLELLDEHGIPAMGVDMNHSMVNACLDRGFLVRHADAIAYLREQEAGSIGAVTGFQIIEHLPFEQLIALFDAARHALCPGGVIIFETPNPENLKVGACNFYFDPTHLHPIVPQVAEFMARQRGFSHAEILRLHPYPDDHLLHGGTAVEAVINKELFGAQDYAVIGRK